MGHESMYVVLRGPTVEGTAVNQASLTEGMLEYIGVAYVSDGRQFYLYTPLPHPVPRTTPEGDLIDLALPELRKALDRMELLRRK